MLAKGDEVCRAVWMQDTGGTPYPRPKRRRKGVEGAAEGEAASGWREDEEGPIGLEPYPLRAAAILEDAYQVRLCVRVSGVEAGSSHGRFACVRSCVRAYPSPTDPNRNLSRRVRFGLCTKRVVLQYSPRIMQACFFSCFFYPRP